MINTTKYGLKKPQDADPADLRIFVGDNMDILDTHTHSWTEVTGKPTTFTPPLATGTTVGGHRVGNGLAMSGEYLLVKTGTGLAINGTTSAVEINRTVTDTWYAPATHTHLWADITDKPTTFTPPLSSGTVVGGHRVGNGLAMSGEYLLVKTGLGLTINATTFALDINRVVTDTWYAPATHTHAYADITGKPTYDNYQGWVVDVGGVTETIGSLNSLIFVGTGGTTISYDTTTNTLTIDSTVGGGGTVDWADILNKPTTFAPSTHTHAWVDITGKPTTFTPNLMSGAVVGGAKVGNGLTMSGEYLLVRTGSGVKINLTTYGVEIDRAVTDPWYASATHTHLWADITDKPTEFSPSAHTHLWADLTDKPTTFAPSTHTHAWADVTGKPTTFTPPLATSSVVGGHRVGNGLGMSGEYLYVKTGVGLTIDVNYALALDKGDYVPVTGGNFTGAITIANKGVAKLDSLGTYENALNSAFRVKEATGYAFPAFTVNKVTFNTEEFDLQNEYDTTTHRFTAKSAGVYIIACCLRLGLADTGVQIFLTIYKNGVEYTRLQNLVNGTLGANTYFQVSGSAIIKLNANDYIELYGYSNKEMSVQSAVGGTFLSGVKIS